MDNNPNKELIENISKEKIADFVLMHLSNMWSVDGIYFMEIEKKYGKEFATEIDRLVWEVMGKIEARKIIKLFNIKKFDLETTVKALQYTGWSLDSNEKEIISEKNKVIIRNLQCRIQNTRIKKGLDEFACKKVRLGFLKSFVKEFNPDIKVKCNICPPDDHPDNLWCEWEFTIIH